MLNYAFFYLVVILNFCSQFSLNKKEEQFPESLTATMQKQIFDTEAICKIDKRLPWVYKLRAKVSSQISSYIVVLHSFM